MPLILEGIVTTTSGDGTINVAPMGPIVDEGVTRLLLRPFRTSTTCANLARTGCGVFHVVDDVLLVARAALGLLGTTPRTFPASIVAGAVLADACRWYEFRVARLDDTRERTEIDAEIVHTGRLRDCFGFNRAKHSVLEAAILATRLRLLPRVEVESQLAALRVPVDKTAGPREQEAFDLIVRHVAAFWDDPPPQVRPEAVE
jgi:hypothetical protein